MPTPIGIVFFVCGLYCFFRRNDVLFGLLIIATIFEASSAVNIAERGIQPYYIIAAMIVLRGFLNWAIGLYSKRLVLNGSWLLVFGVIAIGSAFVLPIVFSGIPIYDAKVGIDAGLLIRPPLEFGLNNVGQAGFLAVHIATAFAIPFIDFSERKTRKAYIFAFYILVLFIAAQTLCQLAGVQLPDSLIRNNPGYAIVDISGFGIRNAGTCTEPSIAGGFLVLYGIGFFAEYLAGKGSALRVLLALLASGAVASSGSLLVLALFVSILLVRYTPFRFPWHINIARTRRLALVAGSLLVPGAFVLTASGGLRTILVEMTVGKGDTSSFFNRTASDLYAIQLLLETHGFGVGLGSNRASSMLSSLLSNIGIAGVLAFAIFFVATFASLPKTHDWLRWGAFALLANMCLGISDVTMPMLWIPILLAVTLSMDRLPTPRDLPRKLVARMA